MKKRMLSVFAAAALVLGSYNTNAQDAYKVNSEKSKLEWLSKKVTGQHNGDIVIKEGVLELDGSKITGGEFTIDMNTINCTDLTGEYKGKLEGHLKAPDFFDVTNHATAKFKIKSITADGNVVGDLTIKGITKEISFPATVKVDGKQVRAEANFKIDRTKWDIKYGSGSFFEGLGDKMIYDDIDFTVSLVAAK